MKFNINDKVKVKLNDLGREIHKSYWAFYTSNYVEPKEDSDGWTTFQLWDLMAIYGPHLSNGCQVPFETEIEF